MAFTFSNLAQAVWADLGKPSAFSHFTATGGSTTTIVNSLLGQREDAPEDNYCLDWTAIVVRDAGGAGASPEGKLSRISAYSSTTYTYTVDNLSDAVASGDEIMIVNADIPLLEMYRASNRALQDMGEVESVDSSLTLGTSAKYTLPAGTKRDRPIRVEYADSDSDERIQISDFKVSADGYLYIPENYTQGRTLYITYTGPHAKLTAYNSAISEDIPPVLIIAATTFYALRWLVGTQAGGSDFWLQRLNEAKQDYDTFKLTNPVRKSSKQTRWFSEGQKYVYPGDQSIYNR